MDEVIIKNKTATKKSISWQNTYSMGELCIDRSRMISNEVGGCMYSIEGTMMTFSRLILKELFRENTEKQANSSLNLLILKRENGSLALTESRRCTSPFICFFQINEKGDEEGTTWAVLALGVSYVQSTTSTPQPELLRLPVLCELVTQDWGFDVTYIQWLHDGITICHERKMVAFSPQ